MDLCLLGQIADEDVLPNRREAGNRGDGLYLPDQNGQPLSPDEIVRRIEQNPAVRDKIAAVAPTVEVFAILQFKYRGGVITKPVKLIGVDPARRAAVGGFAEYLVRQKGSPNPSFDLTPDARRRHEENKERIFYAVLDEVKHLTRIPL